MSKYIDSSTYSQGSRQRSVSEVPETIKDSNLSTNERKKRNRSVSVPTNGYTSFSPSLDEESRMEAFQKSIASSDLTKESSTGSSSYKESLKPSPQSSSPTHTGPIKNEPRALYTPNIKLKPRPPRRSSRSSSDHYISVRPSFKAFHIKPRKIFLPTLQFEPNRSSQKLSQKPPELQNPLPPPPPIAQLPLESSPSSSQHQQVANDPPPLLRERNTKRTRWTPPSSPPKLIPSFDFGLSSITPPSILQARPLAPLMTPPSSLITATKIPALKNSGDALSNNSSSNNSREDGVAHTGMIVAKPIARRPVVTPAKGYGNGNNNQSSSRRAKISFASANCTPRRILLKSHTNESGGSSVSSIFRSTSAQLPAVSSSSVPSSLSLSSTITKGIEFR